MGLLDALKRDKTSLTIEVDPAEVVPGAEVRIRVTLEGEIDDKAQGLRAGLRAANHYLVRERDRHDDDNDVDEVWRAIQLHEETHELPLQAGTHEIACVVPPGALPTSKNAVSWGAFAQLDRKRGMDAKENAVVRVLAPPEAAAETQSVTGEGGAAFADVPTLARAGEEVSGTLTITPSDDLKVTGVELKLRRIRFYREDKITKREDVAVVELGGKSEFRAGDTAQMPFSIPVPPDAEPSVAAPQALVTWELEASFQRRMKSDFNVKAPLVVVNAS